MFPFLRRHYSFLSQIHCNSISMIILYTWVMLIFFIRYYSLFSLFHSLCTFHYISFRIIIIFNIFINLSIYFIISNNNNIMNYLNFIIIFIIIIPSILTITIIIIISIFILIIYIHIHITTT